MKNGSVDQIFSGTHLRATLYGGALKKLLVTFDFRKPGKTEFGPEPTRTTFSDNGFATLSIKTRVNDWFINNDTLLLETALRSLALRFEHVNLLGYSMGGFGAFRFAKALDANAVVAVSPQFSIAPDVTGFDRRFRTEGRQFDPVVGDLTRHAHDGLHGIILADPFVRADLGHAHMLQTVFPRVRIGRLAGGGHPATQVLRDGARTGVLPVAACQTTPDHGAIIAAHRASRSTSPNYWKGLARACGNNRPGLANRALQNATRHN